MKYYIFAHQSSLNNGTACLLTTDSKQTFIEGIEKVKIKRPHKRARIVECDNYTYYSFPDSEASFKSWLLLNYTKKPKSILDYRY